MAQPANMLTTWASTRASLQRSSSVKRWIPTFFRMLRAVPLSLTPDSLSTLLSVMAQ